jgi:predicted adenylyl cyclase CyaB
MHYEVEKRVKRNLKNYLPSEANLKRIFYCITDTYYKFPDPFLRIRHAEMSFPENKPIEEVCMKKIHGENIKEFETSVGDSKCLKEIFNCVIGKPKFVVEGKREEYDFENATINCDCVKKLGNWTEVEIKVKSLNEIAKASEEVERIFRNLGVNKSELVTETYPEMIQKYLC